MLAVVLPVMLSLGICSRVENVRELALGGMVGLGCNVLRLVSCIAPLRYYASPNLFKFLIKFKPVEYLNLRLHFFIFTFFLNLASEASRCNCTEWVRATSYWETVLHVRQVTENTDTVETNVKQLGVMHHGLSTRKSHKIGEMKKSCVIVSDTNRHPPTSKTVPKTKIKATRNIHTPIKSLNQGTNCKQTILSGRKIETINPT